ncbi:glycosyltransferase family 39 protein [Trichocoleus sp. FACHB-591]|uniref:glycosyltransferase family 39 protein n=1 Tax=Trichocoleus sp. FACHB-591 TaxID=2692872 RepID=UPI001688445E|nr:glycosyltransferase family 39 protein [Trichocoleus sp. FACHB-591]MBD2096286.1 glycosyltransferase family 39 protein [Trichocoleus sp. FACHB-591]
MRTALKGHWNLTSEWLKLFLITLLILGIFFRLVNLGQKVYWYDETFTSLRISGYTEAEIVQQFADGREVSAEDLQKYQRPNSEKGLFDTIKSLAIEDPQHVPLYYVMARFWMQLFGDSLAVARSLPALVSLLAFPTIYWLCLELFKSPLTGWMAVALIAVSPFHLLFAQESREYSLWTVATLLSSAVLLWANRVGTRRSWGAYAATVAFGFYSHLSFALVAIAHGLYIFIVGRFRFSKNLIGYVLASLLGFSAFLPWLPVVINSADRLPQLLAKNGAKPLSFFLERWTINISSVFVDINFPHRGKRLLMAAILILILYSIYFLGQKATRKAFLFVLLLIGVTAVFLIAPDFINQSFRSITSRYMIPCYLGIQIAVAHLFATQITSVSSSMTGSMQRQKLWRLGLAALLSGGVLSCILIAQSETWWNKGSSYHNPQIARILNQASQPLVISNARTGEILSLSHLLAPEVRLRIQPACHTCSSNSLVSDPNRLLSIPEGFRSVFLFKPSKKLRNIFEEKYKLESIHKSNDLWRLEKI